MTVVIQFDVFGLLSVPSIRYYTCHPGPEGIVSIERIPVLLSVDLRNDGELIVQQSVMLNDVLNELLIIIHIIMTIFYTGKLYHYCQSA